jgi:hypothetical protein
MKPEGEFDHTAQDVAEAALPVWWYEVEALPRNTVALDRYVVGIAAVATRMSPDKKTAANIASPQAMYLLKDLIGAFLPNQ